MQKHILLVVLTSLSFLVKMGSTTPYPQLVHAQPALLADTTVPIRDVPNDCSPCWCQCKSLSYHGTFGSIEGNCNSLYSGALWCFVENNIGHGFSTCPDRTPSNKFLGESWSNLACVSPQQSSFQCQHCSGIRSRAVAVGPWQTVQWVESYGRKKK